LPRIREYFQGQIVLVNDGPPGSTEAIAKKYDCTYLYTGNTKWRCPAWAFNLGVAASDGETVVLSCAEIYHTTDVLADLKVGDLEMVIPNGRDDNGMYLAYVQRYKKGCPEAYSFLPQLNTKLPFCMALKKTLYQEIGGYDEDFTGQGYDDDDFVTRLLDLGASYRAIPEQVVHLFHDRRAPSRNHRALQYNKRLFEARRGIIVRNNRPGAQYANELHGCRNDALEISF